MLGNSPAPGTGADGSSAGSGGANSNVNYAEQSDDQILDLEEGDGDGGAGDGGQGGDEDEYVSLDGEATDDDEQQGDDEGDDSTDDQDGDEGDEQEGEDGDGEDFQSPDQSQDPANLRGIFKQNPELRDAYWRDQAFREQFPTVAEARKYKELAPSVQELETAVNNSQSLEKLDELYYSNDPAKQGEFWGMLHGEDPEAFKGVVSRMPEALYSLDADLYRTAVAEPVFKSVLANMVKVAMQKDLNGAGKNLMNAIEVLSLNVFGKRYAQLNEGGPGAAKTPREIELEKQVNSFKSRDQQQQSQAFQQFHEAANELTVTGVINSIKGALTNPKSGLLKGTAFENRPKLIDKIVGDIYNQIDGTLKADRALVKQVRNALMDQSGKRDKAHQQKVAQLLISRANKLLPVVAKKVVGEWTNDLVSQNKGKVAAARTAGSRVDITGGAGAAGSRPGAGQSPRGRVKPEQLNYGKTSDDDILSGRVILRK